jgi:dihydrofolate reductase
LFPELSDDAESLGVQFRVMRKVILGLGMSLDGYIARADGAVDFLVMPNDYSSSALAPFFAAIDTAVMGRKTFDVALRMGRGSFGVSTIENYVFSRSQPPGDRAGLTFVNESPATFICELRKHPGKDIWLSGGGELAREFLKADLVDELYLGILPLLLGDGIPLFPSGFPQRDFALVENRTFSQGLIALKYERVRAPAKSKGPQTKKKAGHRVRQKS